MKILDPFRNIIDPDLLSQETFVWLENIGDWVGVYFTTPGKEEPQLLGTLEDRGWVVKYPTKLENENKDPQIPIKKQITKISTAAPSGGALRVYLEEQGSDSFSLFLMDDGILKARVIYIYWESLQEIPVRGDLRTGDGNRMFDLGLAVDPGHYLKVCRD